MSRTEGQLRWDGLEKTQEARLGWFGHLLYRRKMFYILGDLEKDAEDGTDRKEAKEKA